MIIFDQGTRQFSVIEETREFGRYRVGGALLPFNFKSDSPTPVSDIIRTAQGKRNTSQQKKLDKQMHKERMAMIRMGMDPSKLESESLKEQKLRNENRDAKRKYKLDKVGMKYDDKSDTRDYKLKRQGIRNDDRADARAAAIDRMKVRSGRLQTVAADRADARDTRVEMRGLRNQDRIDKRKNKTQRVGIRQTASTDRTKAITDYAGTANENRNKRKMVKYLAE